MILCSQCGFANPTEHRYCENCGTLLPIPEGQLAAAAHRPISGVPSLSFAAASRTGRDRPHNEDDFFAQVQQRHWASKKHTDCFATGLFIVCDGMGGHEGGEEASAIAIRDLSQTFAPMVTLPTEAELLRAVCHANQLIYEQNECQQRRDLARMGTTLVMLLCAQDRVMLTHVGDSRIYQIVEGGQGAKLQQCTRDHELANHLMDVGVPPNVALARPDAHQLTQALGPKYEQAIAPAVQSIPLQESCLFLLCSDGLSDFDVIENHWQEYLLPLLRPDADLQQGLNTFMDLGDRLNGHDNLTAIIVRCLMPPLTAMTMAELDAFDDIPSTIITVPEPQSLFQIPEPASYFDDLWSEGG